MSGSNRYVLAALAGLGALFSAAGFGAYYGSLYSADHKQYGSVASEQRGQDDYQGPSQSLRNISGLPGPFERLIANPPPTSGQDHEKRDLAAQEAMAVWAFWMFTAAVATFGVTSFGTILIWKQVRLTREAVEDTGRATLAMERQNELTAIAQRAWVKLDAFVASISVEQSGFTISICASAENIGGSVAYNMTVNATLIIGPDNIEHEMNVVRKRAEKETQRPLVPGDKTHHWTEGSYHSGKVTTTKLAEEEIVEIMIFVAARYTVPGEPERRIAEQAFRVVQDTGPSPFGIQGLRWPIHQMTTVDLVRVWPAGHLRMT